MKTIIISGVIVPSDYAFCGDLIEAGVITPLANVAYAIAATNDDLEIVINSYGGDVFAGNSISMAIAHWAADHPDRKLFVTVDAIALSAAAVILAKAPENAICRAHRESLIMFHSAASCVCGGPGAMKDCATMMDKVNDGIREILLAKTDIPKETIDEWLSEGRMGWLTGVEAKAHGLVSDLLFSSIPPEKPRQLTAEEAKSLEQPQIAASYRQFADILTNHLKETPMNNEDDEKEKDKDLETEDKPHDTPANEEEDDKEKDKPEEETSENEGDDEGDDDEDKEKEKDEEIENLRNQVAELQARCQKAEKSLARLTSGLHNGAPAGGVAPKSFAEMVAAIPTNITQAEWDDRFLALKKEHPAAFQRWMSRR